MQRFSVIGSTGSGKTTAASAIGNTLGIPVLELDAIHWGPNWTPIDRATIREQVQEFLPGHAWVVDGNYRGMAQDLVWAAAREREEEARQTRPHSDGKSAAKSG